MTIKTHQAKGKALKHTTKNLIFGEATPQNGRITKTLFKSLRVFSSSFLGNNSFSLGIVIMPEIIDKGNIGTLLILPITITKMSKISTRNSTSYKSPKQPLVFWLNLGLYLPWSWKWGTLLFTMGEKKCPILTLVLLDSLMHCWPIGPIFWQLKLFSVTL